MSDQNKDFLTNNYQQQLPNATATLVLGILSIVVCFICGIIALAMSGKDLNLYRNNPEAYSVASYNNIKAGRICAIVGIALQLVGLVIYLVFFAFVVANVNRFN
ncbi:MAG: hypothetical protein KA319_10835 [Ferruginibacter sp.]|nr:hypothetical protein [Ferruginibacter sp.]